MKFSKKLLSLGLAFALSMGFGGVVQRLRRQIHMAWCIKTPLKKM